MSVFDVFKPKWQHSDVSIRRVAVHSLTTSDLDALLDIAKNDKEIEIRKIAVGKINSTSHLDGLFATEQNPEVKEAIKESLRKEWIKSVKNHKGALSPQIRKIIDELPASDIDDLLKNAKSSDVRLECIKISSKQGALSSVAKNDSDEVIATAALAKVDRENLLLEISENSIHESVRRKAKERYKGIQSSKIDPVKQEVEQLKKKQNALISQAKRLLENKQPSSIDAEMQRIMAEAKELSTEDEFQKELSTIREKHSENLVAEKEKIAEEEAKKAAELKAKEDLPKHKIETIHEKTDENIKTNADENQPSKEEHQAAQHFVEIEDKEEHEKKIALLKTIIDKVNALDENGDFNEISQVIRQAFYDWKNIVGEKKEQFKHIYKEFRAATGRFQDLQEWASWNAKRIRENLIKEIEALVNSPVVLDNRIKAFALLSQWKNAGRMQQTELQELWFKFKENFDKVLQSVEPLVKEQEHGQEENLKIKEDICTQIENIASTEGDWQEQYRKFQELKAKWEKTGFVSKDKTQPLRERYHAAVNAFFKKQEDYNKIRKEQATSHIEAREKLCAEAEGLAASTDWKETTRKFELLREEWKNAGSVPNDVYEQLLTRFKAASDRFFENRSEAYKSARTQREELCQKMESLNFNITDNESIQAWKSMEQNWKSLDDYGYSKELSVRFFAVSDRIWEAYSKIDPATAKELDKNWEIKHTITEKIKNVIEQGNYKFKAMQIVTSLRSEWQGVGRCGMAEAEISEKFNNLCKDFFSNYNEQKEIRNNINKINTQKKEDLCKEAEDVLEKAKNKTLTKTEVITEVNALRASWRDSGNIPNRLAKTLWNKFNTACNNAESASEEI